MLALLGSAARPVTRPLTAPKPPPPPDRFGGWLTGAGPMSVQVVLLRGMLLESSSRFSRASRRGRKRRRGRAARVVFRPLDDPNQWERNIVGPRYRMQVRTFSGHRPQDQENGRHPGP